MAGVDDAGRSHSRLFPRLVGAGSAVRTYAAGMDMTGMYAMHNSYAPAPLAEVYQDTEAAEVEAGGYEQSPDPGSGLY